MATAGQGQAGQGQAGQGHGRAHAGHPEHERHDTKHDLPHEGPIKTPKQLIVTVLLAFVIPVVAIMLLVNFVAHEHRPGAGSDGMTPEAIARRIQPVGHVDIRDASQPAALRSGEQVYTAQCAACHATGAAGAPKLGDAAAWAPRIKQGFDALVQSALKGKGNMPPQAGGEFSDVEIARSVAYIANQAGAKFTEPAAPQATAAAAPAAAASPAGGNAPANAAEAAQVSQAAQAVAAAVAAAPKQGATAQAAAVPAIYGQACQACHASGVAGSPKLGDKAAWAPRVAQGIDALTASVVKGKGAMPPRGGSSATDAELRRVVEYMVSQVK
jgi:cytochrome c5